MKELIAKLKQYDLGFIFTIFGLLIFGVIHMVSIIIEFSWLSLNYMMFCYIFIAIMLVVRYLINKDKMTITYLVVAISFIILLIPLTVTLVETIKSGGKPNFIFDWIIYGYALFAFLKMGFAIKDLVQKKKSNSEIFGWLNIIYSVFTMYMLEVALIATFGEGDISMLYMEIASLVAIMLLNVYLIVKYFVLYNKVKRRIENNT